MRSGALARVLPFFIATLALVNVPNFVFASVEITDVMYDVEGADTGREWIKITNTGSEAVDVGGFRLLEAGVHHKLKVVQGEAVLAPSASAIIADNAANFLIDQPGYAEALFDSSFSLSNTGETLVLKNSKGDVEDSYSYTAPVKAPEPKKETQKQRSSQNSAKPSLSEQNGLAESDEENRGPFGKEVTAAAATAPFDLNLLAWLAGLGAVIALGVAGALFIQKRPETRDEAEEFKIVDN